MISTIRLAENDDLAAVDRISQTGHLSGRNAVKQEFYDESSKISL